MKMLLQIYQCALKSQLLEWLQCHLFPLQDKLPLCSTQWLGQRHVILRHTHRLVSWSIYRGTINTSMTAETFFHLRTPYEMHKPLHGCTQRRIFELLSSGTELNSGLKPRLHYLTLILTVASVLLGVGCASSLDSFCVRGTTVVMCSVLFTGFPTGPNITQEAQSSAAAQLAIPHSMFERRVDYPGALWEETGRLMLNDLSSQPFYTLQSHILNSR